VPVGLTQVNGEWLYDEFTGDAARHTLDMDEAGRRRECGAGAGRRGAPAPAAPATPNAENIKPVPTGPVR
jgi:penicillin-binding protein 1A